MVDAVSVIDICCVFVSSSSSGRLLPMSPVERWDCDVECLLSKCGADVRLFVSIRFSILSRNLLMFFQGIC
jgi:hypothetical protein